MKSIPFFLITGFLGSGKTTLLKRILDNYADNKKIAVIQNEFAPGNIDGIELKQSAKPFKLLEINKGSVFCVCLLSDFVRSLRALIDEYQPDAVFLEATGLADPIAIAQLLQSPTLRDITHLSHVWSVIDATTFLRMEKSVRSVPHQIRVADTIVINKSEKANVDISGIKIRIKDLNPFADTITTSYADCNLENIFRVTVLDPVAIRIEKENQKFEPCGRPPVRSVAVKTTNTLPFEALQKFIKDFEMVSYRLKGFCYTDKGGTAIQSCFGETHYKYLEGFIGPSELIALGPDLNPEEFTRQFKEMAGE
jgi:G3E family GTPase